jgi:spermidine synthase
MAVIWQKSVNGKRYEVRAAGNTQRLYTDGVFHSQYNPNKTLTGNVWDLLSLPSLFLAAEQIRRVLVLGVGGGAVMHQLASWHPYIELTGIELDKTHIAIARRFFRLRGKHITLIHADAIDWVKRYRGLPFDLVIDDLFAEVAGEPERVIAASKTWLNHLTRLMTPHAALVMNFTEAKDLRAVLTRMHEETNGKFTMAYRFMTPLYENQIGAFLRQPCKKIFGESAWVNFPP